MLTSSDSRNRGVPTPGIESTSRGRFTGSSSRGTMTRVSGCASPTCLGQRFRELARGSFADIQRVANKTFAYLGGSPIFEYTVPLRVVVQPTPETVKLLASLERPRRHTHRTSSTCRTRLSTALLTSPDRTRTGRVRHPYGTLRLDTPVPPTLGAERIPSGWGVRTYFESDSYFDQSDDSDLPLSLIGRDRQSTAHHRFHISAQPRVDHGGQRPHIRYSSAERS